MARLTTRLDMRKELVKQLANKSVLEHIGSNPRETFADRYLANVMAEQAAEVIADLRSMLRSC